MTEPHTWGPVTSRTAERPFGCANLVDKGAPVIEKSATGWRCRLGRHAYASRRDDNSETPGRTIRVCIVCGKYFEPESEPEFDVEAYQRNTSFFG